MSRPPGSNKVPTKDMYWFAHGGVESTNDKCLNQRNTTSGEHEEDVCDSSSPASLRSLPERRVVPEEQKTLLTMHPVSDFGNSSGPPSLEIKDDRNRDKQKAVEERRKLLLEAEQERNDAMLRKHMEREAAIEARRNAQRSNISFAFGSSVPRNVDNLDSERSSRQANASGLSPKEENPEIELLRRSVSPSNLWCGSQATHVCWDRRAFSPPCWLVGSGALIGEDVMSKSMTAAVPAPRGRRKNDLMPTVPYDRTAAPKSASSGTNRKRSVSMTRLDQLAQPRRHYVEASKACSTTSSGTSSIVKDSIKSPTRPLSSASEQSGGSGRPGTSVTRRLRSSPRKPRPVSIAGTVPDSKPPEIKVSPIKKMNLASRKPQAENKKATPVSTPSSSAVKCAEKGKRAEKSKPYSPPVAAASKTKGTTKQPPPPKTSSPKVSSAKRATTNKKKADLMVSSSQQSTPVKTEEVEETQKILPPTLSASPPPVDGLSEGDRNNAKRIISEEEAKASLAEKRRLAREQAEKEAELEKQRLEEIRLEEEERVRREEEEQRRLEEETLRLLAEHQRVEEEKLRRAIEENERKEEEERLKREEEQRLKAEQEKKALEEAEKQRVELEEKLRKEEEERAERKKRLEKIMSRTRGKSSNTSPSGSVSGSEHFDSSENQQENFSSGANSLESNSAEENNSEITSLECLPNKSELASEATSLGAHPAYDVSSDNESLVDIIMPKSETASQDNSLVIVPEKSSSNPFESHTPALADPELESNVEDVTLDADPPTSDGNDQSPAEVSQLLAGLGDQDSKVAENLDKIDDVEELSSDKLAEGWDKSEEKLLPEAAFLTAAVVSASFETDSFDKDGDILPLDESKKTFGSTSASFSDSSSTLLPDAPLCSESEASAGQGCQDEAEREQHSHLSTSSDIKLPDPIYETSDDGSVSSEKHHPDGSVQEEEPHQEVCGSVADEVFSAKEEAHFGTSEKMDVEKSPDLIAVSETQMEESTGVNEAGDAVSGNVEQPREIGEENVYPARSSSLPESGDNLSGAKGDVGAFQDGEENKENILDYEMMSSQWVAPTTGADDCTNNYDFYADKENMQFSFPHNTIPSDMPLFNNGPLPEQSDSKVSQVQEESSNVPPESVQFAENPFLPQSSPKLSSEEAESGTITLIKTEGSGESVGIISSLEHDQVSNELTRQSELLVSNFEYSSITDSEDSSLDSNLSQVMTAAEVGEKNSVISIDESSTIVLNNGQTGNPFEKSSMNGSKDSFKANGDYSKTEAYSNGHRFDASDAQLEELSSYTPLDGKHISSVDPNNIFDNVDAVDFGKMSPDPFLAKGTPNSISGNPFLIQEEQKQVIMTPDFLN